MKRMRVVPFLIAITCLGAVAPGGKAQAAAGEGSISSNVASQFSSSTPARLDFDLQPSDRENRASQLFLRSQWTYEKTYCQRGDVENRIKELHDGMQIRRTSCSNFLANTFRVLLTAAA